MTDSRSAYHIFPLGDSAITVELGTGINMDTSREVLNRFHALQKLPLAGMTEVTPAYNSFTIYYDVVAVKQILPRDMTVFEHFRTELVQFLSQTVPDHEEEVREIEIPVCYGGVFGPDAGYVAAAAKLSEEEVFRIHSGQEYKVYMLGFLPGFAYMGTLDDRLDLPRKPQPVNIAAGSVGIAGKQTGIYPLASPGGWQIIGRTPLKLFDKTNEHPVLLRAGDRIRFISISADEFENY